MPLIRVINTLAVYVLLGFVYGIADLLMSETQGSQDLGCRWSSYEIRFLPVCMPALARWGYHWVLSLCHRELQILVYLAWPLYQNSAGLAQNRAILPTPLFAVRRRGRTCLLLPNR